MLWLGEALTPLMVVGALVLAGGLAVTGLSRPAGSAGRGVPWAAVVRQARRAPWRMLATGGICTLSFALMLLSLSRVGRGADDGGSGAAGVALMSAAALTG